MNASRAQPVAKAASSGKWLWALAALVVGLVAVSNDSLWIDEALTANEVSHASIRGVWQVLVQDKASDLQMPLYVFHLWLWVKIFGTSEWALRAVNILWFAGGFSVLLAAFAGRERRSLAIVALVCPFTWYFLNEARPYAMQIGASLIAFAAVCRLAGGGELTARSERNWAAVFCFGVVALSGSSLLGMIWAVAFVFAAAWFIPAKRLLELVRINFLSAGLSVVVLAALGAYYLWTLHVGARATAGNTGARNLVFIAYELLGFGGLGPGRLDIREGSSSAFVSYVVPLAVYGALLLYVMLAGLGRVGRMLPLRLLLGLLAIVAVPALIILAAGWLLHFRVLERHFAPVVVLVVFVLGAGLAENCRRGVFSRSVVCGFVGLSLWSCVEVRFALRQKKDDYRDAAAFAQDAVSRGRVVWWNASEQGAAYYHLALSSGADQTNTAIRVQNSGALSALPTPDVVVMSKPDLFDADGSVAGFIRTGPYARSAEFPAFTVWQRAAKP